MSQQPKGNILARLYKWVYDGLSRTYWMGVQFTYPKRFVSPLG